ncbi:type I polyketide synthase [Phytomonospora endophytica]|uniref:Acyl transferase domain-containing protein n=1 Tax=Phytomonospora endophytica TaxID=714109 RepID=A0A841FTR7_9ACTN|nr:type I polyketide synthase [Phytomonospora endophytica]MBB6038183.1 acyl transferase domain-containing protein [Phytomonospora endophytica]GIG67356.1 hypothetical protein Pen01_36510 [Phytomonospora endophytica]
MTDETSYVAVVGMAGRFPGAADLDRFWANLAAGVESIEPLPAPPGASHQPAMGVLDDADRFDAGYFGYAPGEAMLIDPQHRLFMECAVEALEDAGEDPDRFGGPVGVYGGNSNSYYRETLRPYRDLIGSPSEFQLQLGSGSDFLTSRVAYQLGLRGPAVSVQTACSTSLVAVHQAVQALLAGECDMALAGGTSVHVPVYPGEYTEGGVLTADGHCRAFDAAASGVVSGMGVGIVVLKRLDDALADGNTIQAVLLGTAVNNDGRDKIGFTAPSVDGQAEVMRTALAVAGVDPDTVGYVEAHGTGTPLGDPIEVAALTAAYGRGTEREDVCWLGSVKTNIGHTDAAAGVAGLIKVVLALRERRLPPSLHFTTPNPGIDFANSPFKVNTWLRDWRTLGGAPRRAAVNALGLGGTNAHVLVEEPTRTAPTDPGRPWQLAVLSARSRSALAAAKVRLAEHLERHPDLDLADVAWTTQIGRRELPFRQSFVASDTWSLAKSLREPAPTGPVAEVSAGTRQLVMFFPGQGGQKVGMAADLYRHERRFREVFDEAAALFTPLLGLDLRQVVYPAAGREEAAVAELAAMTVSHAAIFSVEYALFRLWRHWGVTPDLVAGHSLGAIVAATAAGVFGLDDAVSVVAERSRLLQELPPGAMIAVPIPEPELAGDLHPELAIAAVNSPDQCVVTGPAARIDELAARLAAREVTVRRLHIPAAAHSTLIDPVLPGYTEFMASVRYRDPVLPLLSDRTGRALDAAEVRDPRYWAGHLRNTVRFGEVVSTVLGRERATVLEVGPGHTLSTLARRHPGFGPGHAAVASLPHPADDASDLAHLLGAAGALWELGHGVDWSGPHDGARRLRVPLPTYPFERTRFRVDPAADPPVAIEPPVTGDDDGDDAGEPPSTEAEAAVAASFERVLGVAVPGRRANFLDLGGDSLLATQLTAWIRRDYRVRVLVREFLKAPTVAELARLIDERAASATTERKES